MPVVNRKSGWHHGFIAIVATCDYCQITFDKGDPMYVRNTGYQLMFLHEQCYIERQKNRPLKGVVNE